MKRPIVGRAGMWAWLLLAGVLPCVRGSEGSIVYFANGLDIQELTVVAHASQPRSVVDGLADAEALDYDPVEDRIYWIDSADKRIRRAFSNGTAVETVVTFDLTRPAGIAVDPLGKNVFFSDKDQKRITVVTQTGQYRRILLWEGLTSPEAIQLDLSRGLLFWLDTGPPVRVERTRVDGTERSIVINLTDPGIYHGLALDAARQRLYWTRTADGKAIIEYCFYNGSGRGELEGSALRNSTPYAVTVQQDTLFWSQLSTVGINGSIFSRPMDLGEAATLYENYSLLPYDIAPAFSNHSISGSHPCMHNNGGCQKICVPFSSTEGRCLCQSGEEVRTSVCSTYLREAVLVGYSSQVRVLVAQPGQPTAALLDFQLPVEAANVTSIDHYSDYEEDVVVWSEDHSEGCGMGVIKKAVIDSSGITVTRLLSVAASSVSVHAILRQVYWVDSVLGLVGVVGVNDKNPHVIFEEGLNSPRALVLNRRHSLLVWAELDGEGAAILYSPLDGSWKAKLYNLSSGSKPAAMTIDETTTTLYWVDTGLEEIGYAHWNVSQPQRLVALEEGQYLSDITLKDGYLYLTDQSSGRIQRLLLGGENPAFELVFEGLRAPRAAVAANPEEDMNEIYGFSDCEQENYCSGDHQVCFPVPVETSPAATCECTSGYHLLDVSNAGCIADPSYYILGGAGFAVFQDISNVADSGAQVFTYLDLPSYSLDLVTAHYRSKRLLWYDSGREGIYSVSLEYHFDRTMDIVVATSSPHLVVNVTGHGPVGGIDVDWLGGNIFWTLPEEGRIDYAAVDGLGHRVFKAGLTGLTRLAVDSESRTVYWVQRESSVEVVLFCKFDDCSTPQTLYLPDGQVRKLYFEVQERSLFAVKSSDEPEALDVTYYNFETGQVLNLHSDVVESVAAWGTHIFLLIDNSNQSQLVCLVQQHGECVDRDLLNTNIEFHDITVLSPISQRGFHVCQFGKAGCSHVCLPQQEGFVCQCPPHMTLGEDGKTCTDVKPFLLVSTQTDLLLAPYQAGSNLSWDKLQRLPFTGHDIQFIQYDPYFEEVFVLENDTRTLIALSIGNWTQRTVANLSLFKFWPWSRLQYDRLGGNLFWSEQVHFIDGVGRRGGSPEVIEYDTNTRFMDIAVDPLHGRLYWISLIDYSSTGIRYRNLSSSSGLDTLPIDGLRRPRSLVFDDAVDHGNLFWVDAAINTVYYYNFTSQQTTELVVNVAVNSSKPLLRVAEDYVYWYEPKKNAIMKNKKTVSHQHSTAVSGVQGITDFVITLSHYSPSKGVPPCLEDSEPCEYWCTSNYDLSMERSLSYQCTCPYGYYLDREQQCEPLDCSAAEVQCGTSKQCILSIYECDGKVDCLDGSDEDPILDTCECSKDYLPCDTGTIRDCIPYEERCTEENLQRCTNLDADNQDCIQCDTVTQFMCADMQACVDIAFRCEPYPNYDCDDRSDQMNCNITGPTPTPSTTVIIPIAQSSGDQPAILATSLLLSISTALVLVFVGVLLLKYLRDKRSPKSATAVSQNGSSALLTRMSVSTAQGGEVSQSEGSFCSMSTLTRETHVSSATEPDMSFTIMPGLIRTKPSFSGSDHSLETMVASDPPPSPITQKSIAMVPHPSIVTFDHEFLVDPDLHSYRAPNPSVNFSCMSEYDKFSSVSEREKPHNVQRKPPHEAHFQPQLQRFNLDYGVFPPVSAGSPSDVVSLASNSHCTPPPPPSPVTLRSNGEFLKDDINYTSSSTMV